MFLKYGLLLIVLFNILIDCVSSLSSTDIYYQNTNSKISSRWKKRNNSQHQSDNNDNGGEEQNSEVDLTLNRETKFIAECNMPSEHGFYKMRSYVYRSPSLSLEPIVMVSGDLTNKENVLVRVHDQCFTSEVFGSLRCDCKDQLRQSLSNINEHGGVVIYLQQEGRGIGIANKIAAYELQDKGMDTVDANTHLGFSDEMREYNSVPAILKDLGIKSIRLMTNNPYKMEQLGKLGVTISERVPLQVQSNQYNQRYLRSKKEKMNHFLHDELLELKPIVNAAIRPFVTQSTSDEVNRNKDSSAHADPMTVADTITDALAQQVDLNDVEDETIPEPVRAAVRAVGGYEFGKASVIAAIDDIKKGKLVIVVDDANRENEGDLIMAAEKATPDTIGMMIRYSSGVLCVSLEGDRLDALNLPPMVVNNEDPKGTAYSVSVDYKYNTSTGISSADRALTFRKLVDPSAKPEDFQRPGHVFPLRYAPGGVKSRAGHTEASLDLSRMAGLSAGGVLAEVVHDDGSMQRLPDLYKLSVEKHLVLTSVQDIKAYRVEQETLEALKKE